MTLNVTMESDFLTTNLSAFSFAENYSWLTVFKGYDQRIRCHGLIKTWNTSHFIATQSITQLSVELIEKNMISEYMACYWQKDLPPHNCGEACLKTSNCEAKLVVEYQSVGYLCKHWIMTTVSLSSIGIPSFSSWLRIFIHQTLNLSVFGWILFWLFIYLWCSFRLSS